MVSKETSDLDFYSTWNLPQGPQSCSLVVDGQVEKEKFQDAPSNIYASKSKVNHLLEISRKRAMNLISYPSSHHNRCMTETHERTTCTPITHAPTWLHVARICVVLSTCITIASIMYMMRSMAKRETNLSVMIGVNTFKCVIYLVGVVVYTVKGGFHLVP